MIRRLRQFDSLVLLSLARELILSMPRKHPKVLTVLFILMGFVNSIKASGQPLTFTMAQATHACDIQDGQTLPVIESQFMMDFYSYLIEEEGDLEDYVPFWIYAERMSASTWQMNDRNCSVKEIEVDNPNNLSCLTFRDDGHGDYSFKLHPTNCYEKHFVLCRSAESETCAMTTDCSGLLQLQEFEMTTAYISDNDDCNEKCLKDNYCRASAWLSNKCYYNTSSFSVSAVDDIIQSTTAGETVPSTSCSSSGYYFKACQFETVIELSPSITLQDVCDSRNCDTSLSSCSISTTSSTSSPTTTDPPPTTTEQGPITPPVSLSTTTEIPPTTTEPGPITPPVSLSTTTEIPPTTTEQGPITPPVSLSTTTEIPATSTTGTTEFSAATTETANVTVICKTITKTNKSIEEQLEEIEKELTIDPSTTSSARRQKSSVGDERPSSSVIGWIGTFFLSAVFGPIILSDIPRILNDIRGPHRMCQRNRM